MNPGYFRIKLKKKEAIQRLCDWNGSEYKESIQTNYSNAVKASIDQNGQWKGSCLYVYQNEDWTVFEDLSGFYSFIPPESWLEFAKGDEMVFVAYNDAMLYAEMIAVVDGAVIKYFVEDFDMPEDNTNKGSGYTEIQSWMDVADFMDHDEYYFSDQGMVLIF